MEHLYEQLRQIAICQPLFAGDLISKQDKNELVKLGYVLLYEDEKVCGYCLTELGDKKWREVFLKKHGIDESELNIDKNQILP